MQWASANGGMLAAVLGGWEIIILLTIGLVLLGAKRLPEMSRGLRRGVREFGEALEHVDDELKDKEDGLVYEALTCDNRTAEFVYPYRH